MTRIYDALRKVQSARGRAASSAAPAIVPVPPAPARSNRPVAERAHGRGVGLPRAIVPLTASVELPPDVVREMTALRMSLEAGLTERIPRIVMFLASQGGEGTSTVAAQFAESLASDARLRVLLVDAHARRPAYGPGGVPQTAPRGHAAERAGSDPAEARNLDLLPLLEEQRAEQLLEVNAMRDSLEEVASGYDWIVLDGPPVLESPDAAPLGSVADGVIVVVQAGRTKRPVLARSVDLLRRAGGRVLGTVLNRRRLEIPGFIYRRI
jgi:Mrp family chromosome partitioning ATPase